jgi:stage II sporulation protein D
MDIKKMKKYFTLLFLLFTLISPLTAQKLPETVVKIGIALKIKAFNLNCDGDYTVEEAKSGVAKDIESNYNYTVKVDGESLFIGAMKYQLPLNIQPKHPGGKVKVNAKKYRGSLEVVLKDGCINVINVVSVDDYLYGVLPREVDPGWEMEALKAQAVVSRTFLLKNLKKHEMDGFDLCDSVHCQVYGGADSEKDNTSRAVEETRDVVMVFDGQLADGIFHACCAGHTENPNDVWSWDSAAPKYLRGVKCKFCKSSPHYKWERDLSMELLTRHLIKAGYDTKQIKKIERGSKTGSGRIKNIKVKCAAGTVVIPINKFRLAVGPDIIRSSYIDSISIKNSRVVFKGKGWGHGVGMCQWGAKVMADKKYNYKEILNYYYPGTKVERWDE